MDLDDATVVLTGASSGIGRATASALAGQVRRLIIHGPQPADGVADLIRELRSSLRAGGDLIYVPADYGRLGEAARLAGAVRSATDHIDVLINNAARPGPARRTLSGDGHELTLQTNYLAPVALTMLLLGGIGTGRPGRIVNVASATHLSAVLQLDDLELARHPYMPATAYAHSKLALVTYTCWLAGTLSGTSVDAVSMHPGVIDTDLLHAMFPVGGVSPAHAAGNLIHVATRSGDNGTYYDERRPATPNPAALRPGTQRRLLDATMAALAPVVPSAMWTLRTRAGPTGRVNRTGDG